MTHFLADFDDFLPSWTDVKIASRGVGSQKKMHTFNRGRAAIQIFSPSAKTQKKKQIAFAQQITDKLVLLRPILRYILHIQIKQSI